MEQQGKSSGLLIALGIMAVGVAYGIQQYASVNLLVVIVPALLVIGLSLVLMRRRNNPPRSGS